MRHAERKPQVNQSDYIRNLQQQIYLLELETRYMKAGKKQKGGMSGGSMNQLRQGGSMMLANAASMNGLDQEDEREVDEEIVLLRKDFEQREDKLQNEIQELKRSKNELVNSLKQLEGNSR